jgi:transposase
MRYIQGIDRDQTTMLPNVLDDYISKENPVLFIDAFIDNLDLVEFGFTHSEPKEKGRMPYNPADLLKLYIYGYLNKIRSSRRLDKATYQNIELMWLLRRLHPDFKTVADFRKNNLQPIRSVCRDFTLLCKKLNLFGCELIAIDGSKFSAVNHNHRSFTKKKLKEMLKVIDNRIDAYLKDLDQSDQTESDVKSPTKEDIQVKIDELKVRKNRYERIKEQLEKSGENQISLTDPDSRMMKNSKGTDVSYNVQIVTDSKHKLIVDHEVTNEATDERQLSNMAIKAKETLGVNEIEALGDKGYYSKEEIKKCEDEHIVCYVPTYNSSRNKKAGLYTIADFNYQRDEDNYICPTKQKLTFNHTTQHSGKQVKVYSTQTCSSCNLMVKCTKAKHGRIIRRWVHQNVIDDMVDRVKKNPDKMDKRKSLVEHPFGTIKHNMDHGYFLMRGFKKVSAEMSLSVLCYNMKRVLNIIDFKELMAVVT